MANFKGIWNQMFRPNTILKKKPGSVSEYFRIPNPDLKLCCLGMFTETLTAYPAATVGNSSPPKDRCSGIKRRNIAAQLRYLRVQIAGKTFPENQI